MQIPVNKNIDVYKDDFFRGLSMKETITAAAMILSGTAGFLFFYMYLGLPQTVAMYCMLPLPMAIGVAGFLRIRGRSLPEYLKSRRKIMDTPVYYFRPRILEEAEPHTDGRQHTGTGKGRKRKIYLGEDGELTGNEKEHEGL